MFSHFSLVNPVISQVIGNYQPTVTVTDRILDGFLSVVWIRIIK